MLLAERRSTAVRPRSLWFSAIRRGKSAHGADPCDRGLDRCTFRTSPSRLLELRLPDSSETAFDSNPPALWIPLNDEPVLEGETSILQTAGHELALCPGARETRHQSGSLQGELSNRLRQWLGTQRTYTLNGADKEIPKQHVVLTPGGAGIQNMQDGNGQRPALADP